MERSTERKRRVFQRPADIVEDSYFDSLAASVQEHLQRGVKTLVITSSGAGEGKSTITAGLARALARPGRLSVCIVDTDRYRPTLHRLFALENRRGLGELLKELYHLDIGKETPAQLWDSKKLPTGYASPLIHQGRVYTLSYKGILNCAEAARAAFTVQAVRPGIRLGRRCVAPPKKTTEPKPTPCTRYVRLPGRFSHSDEPGRNSLHWSGWLGRTRLAPGAYRLTVRPSLGKLTGKPVRTAFRVRT